MKRGLFIVKRSIWYPAKTFSKWHFTFARDWSNLRPIPQTKPATEQVTGCLVTIVGSDLNKTLKRTALRKFWLKWSIHTRTAKSVFTRRRVSFHTLVQLRSDTTHFQLFETRPQNSIL